MNVSPEQLVTSFVILASIIFYITKLIRLKEDERGQRILGVASQITMSAFMLGFAVIMCMLNILQLQRGSFVISLLYYAAFVSLVNVLSILYYERKL